MAMATDPEDRVPSAATPAGGDCSAKLIARLRRVEGQARGLQRMLEEGRSCDEVIIQLAAMKAAVNRIGLAVIGEYLTDCLTCQRPDGGDRDEAYERALKLLMKLS